MVPPVWVGVARAISPDAPCGFSRQGSGLPAPVARTFASGILPFALSMLATLRHPAFACHQRRLQGAGNPSQPKVELAGNLPAFRR
jgi:hypothetical protein